MATVSDDGMRTYLEVFHRVYRDATQERLPADLRSSLRRAPYLTRGLVAYISTQMGAGFEYESGGSYRLSKGSSRIEDLVFGAPRPVRTAAPMVAVAGRDCVIGRLTTDGAFPVRLTTKDASVTLYEMRAKAGAWTRDIDWAELYGDNSSDFWSSQAATSRALDEVLRAVVDAREMERRHLDLGDFMSRYRQGRVLVLGDFNTGRDRVLEIAATLEELGFLPVIADEIPDVREHDLRQKVIALALMSRFVVIDDSSAAGQLAEIPLIESVRVPAVILRRRASRSSWVTAGIDQTSSVLRTFDYDEESLVEVLREGLDWVQERLDAVGDHLDNLFPWRQPKTEV